VISIIYNILPDKQDLPGLPWKSPIRKENAKKKRLLKKCYKMNSYCEQVLN